MKIIIVHGIDGQRNVIRYTKVKKFNITCYNGMLLIYLNRNFNCEKWVNEAYCKKAGKDWLESNVDCITPYSHLIYNVKSVKVV